MSQLILFPVELVDPSDVESEEQRLARMNVVDAWRESHLRRFWNARRAAILASGDPVRQRLLREHDEREAERMRGVA